MPSDDCNLDELLGVRPDTDEAKALSFLYANSDYGFKPAEICDHTSIPNNSSAKALSRLFEKDVIGKTADGYYHALDDAYVAQFVENLHQDETFGLNSGKVPHPEDRVADDTS